MDGGALTTAVAGPFGAGASTIPTRSPPADWRLRARAKALWMVQSDLSLNSLRATPSSDRAVNGSGAFPDRATILAPV